MTTTGAAISDLTRSKRSLMAENAFLRHQLVVLSRGSNRPRITQWDRTIMVLLARMLPNWRDTLLTVKPETLLNWHRNLFRIVWRRKSRPKGKPTHISQETIELIKQMARDNRLWGAERIRGELLKLGIRVSKRTVQKYMRDAKGPRGGGQTWTTFLHNHVDQIWTCDFLQTHDLLFRPIFVFVIIELHTRRVIYAAVTRSPTDEWTSQQLRNTLLDHAAPRFLIRDNDNKYGSTFQNLTQGSGVEVLRTPIRAPRANAVCERFLGSLRRECLDHLLVLSEDHLRRIVTEYIRYHNESRPHQGLGQAIPTTVGQQKRCLGEGEVKATPILGGLHHDYRRAA
jgi:transposase InsO family protein